MKENGEFKIEKGVPVNSRRGKGYSSVLRKLGKGDSVVLPTTPYSVRNLALAILGKGNYATHQEKEGTRVWRIK